MAIDYYLVLGIPRDADLTQIKRAYRRLVKQTHPDATDPAGAGGDCPRVDQFLQVREAYHVLSDPKARRAHDDLLRRLEWESNGGRVPREPLYRPSRPGEPIHPAARSDLWTELDHWLGGWLPGVPARSPALRRPADLYAEISLTSAEAARGGRLPLTIPFEKPCLSCAGQGCDRCAGRGWSIDHHHLDLTFPAGLADGTRQRIDLGGVGLRGVGLIVLITVAGEGPAHLR